jgi:hypothetical protein
MRTIFPMWLHDAAPVIVGAARALLREDHLDVVEAGRRAVDQAGARHRGRAAAIAAVTKIKNLVAGVIAVEPQVEQAALSARMHRRHAGERRRQRAVARDDAHAAGLLRHQHAAVGQKCEAPWIDQAARDGRDRDRTGRRRKRLCVEARRHDCEQRGGGEHDGPVHGASTPDGPTGSEYRMPAPVAGSRSALSGGLHGARRDAAGMRDADRNGGCGNGDRQHQRHRRDELGHHPAAASAHADMVARRKAGLVDRVGRHGLSLFESPDSLA